MLKLCSDYISSLHGFIAFHKASTASKSTSWSEGPSIAMIISLNIDAGISRLRSRSLICFISLKERSTVAVDTGSTMAMVSRILMLGKVTHFPHFSGTVLQVPSMTNSSPQKWPIWMLSTHILSQSYRHLLELIRPFPYTQSQLSPHRILGASPILQCHICSVAGHLLGISVDRRCWKQSRGPRYLWNDSWFACWPLPGKAAAHSCWNFLLLSPDLQHQLQGLWLCHGLWKGTPDH